MAGNVDADPFKKGTQVEVRLEDDGFWGSWYTATVVRLIFKKTYKIHLKFHTLTSADNFAKPLRWTQFWSVPSRHARHDSGLMSTRTLMPFTMTAGGRALSLLP
ncbi:Uncharacterized protein Adt_23599 [Abeliophyllum distichum]|uniref:Agenet domain-containing protein n=1 Tax=Abeliophyllum distichum TaxID=126358 RepID=A0ABD1SBA8_9LAMI